MRSISAPLSPKVQTVDCKSKEILENEMRKFEKKCIEHINCPASSVGRALDS